MSKLKTAGRRGSRSVWLRRAVQVCFLCVFVGFVVAMQPDPEAPPSGWLGAFFYLDPLLLVLTGLAAWAVPTALLLSLVTVVVTGVLGRVFCGWFCPLGTLHSMAARFFDYWRPRRVREHWNRWQLSKYYIFAALVVLAALGVQWPVLLDPFALLYRSMVAGVLPGVQWAVEASSTAVYQRDPALFGWHVTSVTEPVYEVFRDYVFVTERQAFVGGGLILGFLLFTLGLNYFQRRFWCRYVCPMGGMLGLLAWRPILRRRVDETACNQCDLCGMTCHGSASGKPGAAWKAAECFGCLNCTDSCNRDGLDFEVVAPWETRAAEETVDISRRGLLGAATFGVASAFLLRVTPRARGEEFSPHLVRPPGAGAERDFLSKCIGCGACMRVCPTGGLQPTIAEAGLEGVFTPRLVPRIGYCDYVCNACGSACPTGALEVLPLADKQQLKLGLAVFDVSRCLPYAFGRNCMVCEEHCPVPDKAIYFRAVEQEDRDGVVQEILKPVVDPDKCIGCGICENVCPFVDRPAIRVTSANETRHPDNQPILPLLDGYGGY